MPAFGWSVGDIIAVVGTIHELSKGFREVSGAEDHFWLSGAWLESFGHDLQRVQEFMSENPTAACIPGLQEKLLLIKSAYVEFELYMEKYDLFMPQPQGANNYSLRTPWRQVKKATQTMKWTWKELNGHVDALRTAVSIPLAEMNLILLLDLWYALISNASELFLTIKEALISRNSMNDASRCPKSRIYRSSR